MEINSKINEINLILNPITYKNTPAANRRIQTLCDEIIKGLEDPTTEKLDPEKYKKFIENYTKLKTGNVFHGFFRKSKTDAKLSSLQEAMEKLPRNEPKAATGLTAPLSRSTETSSQAPLSEEDSSTGKEFDEVLSALYTHEMRSFYESTSRTLNIIDSSNGCSPQILEIANLFQKLIHQEYEQSISTVQLDQFGTWANSRDSLIDDLATSLMPFHTENPERKNILHSEAYGELMKDPDVLFHGINTAIWKIPSILELGILSKSKGSSHELSLGFNYGRQTELGIENGYNGEDFISCARSPVHSDSLGDTAGAFRLYITDGISFAVRGTSAIPSYTTSHDSGIPGEAFVRDAIPSTSIVGLVVPQSLLSTKVSDINFLQGGALYTFHLRCQGLLRYLDGKVDINPSLRSAVANTVTSEEERARLEPLFNELLLKSFSSRIDVKSARFSELLKIMIPSNLTIYDTKGMKIP